MFSHTYFSKLSADSSRFLKLIVILRSAVSKFQLGNAFKEQESSLPARKMVKGLDTISVMEIVEDSCAEEKYAG